MCQVNENYLYTLSIIPPPRHLSPSYRTQNCPGVTAFALSYINFRLLSSKYSILHFISFCRYLNLQEHSFILSSVKKKDGKYVLTLYNATDKENDAQVLLIKENRKINVSLGKYELKQIVL